MSALLEVEGLRAGYGSIQVLHGLDLRVAEGEVVVVLGANGAGKTTSMRSLAGVIARRGTIRFAGQDISRASAESIVRAGIAMVPEGRGTFPDLTVEENLRLGGYIHPSLNRSEIERWYDTFPVLGRRRTQKAGSLSGGEQQMLAIARALVSRPRLLLCDEPSLGLAPVIVAEMFRVIEGLNKSDGLAVLLVEQNANLAIQIADRAYVLEAGTVVASGTAEEVSAQESIRKAYLGY
ncbi:MAG TPA: ABC transporter ATP-binding protein [Micromonosporaceae bacterium]